VTLLNDYIVLGALGKGAYGSVKLCYSMQDDNLYALKVLQRTQLKRQMLGPRRAAGGGGDALEMLRWDGSGRRGQPRTALLLLLLRGWQGWLSVLRAAALLHCLLQQAQEDERLAVPLCPLVQARGECHALHEPPQPDQDFRGH
jgi:hypothetical protein